LRRPYPPSNQPERAYLIHEPYSLKPRERARTLSANRKDVAPIPLPPSLARISHSLAHTTDTHTRTFLRQAIPVLLVISQSASMKLLQPPEDPNADPDAPNPNAVLKFLPLLIGWFSLNVPAALGIYW